MQKVFIISAGLLLPILLLLAIYNLVFKEEKVVDQSVINDQTQGLDENSLGNSVIRKKIMQVTDVSIISPTFDETKEKIKYYDKSGIVWQIDADGGNKKQLSSQKLNQLKEVLWSPDKKKVITHFSENGERFYYYDFKADKVSELKKGLDFVRWDTLGTRIIYKYFDEESKKRSLNISNIDGSDWKELAPISYRYISVSPIPQSSIISFWNMPKATDESILQLVGSNGGEIRTLLKGKYGADYLWSTDGQQALVSSLMEKGINKINLGLVSMDGQYKSLDIPTLVSKAVWSSDKKTLYYALPGDIPEGSIMPDDYDNRKIATSDTFWSVDVTIGTKQRLVELKDIPEKYDASNLFLSPTEDALYFINRSDNKLYRIEF